MIEVKIDCWKLQNLFNEKRELYEKLYSISKESFLSLPDKYEAGPDGKITKSNYTDMKFYVSDLNKINLDLLKYCELSPVGMLEMMGGAKINTENVVEAMKRNQIMLPNNLMLDMKELKVETDCCTDEINRLMQDGWKLIAILPQHQQKRPDYILGKSN